MHSTSKRRSRRENRTRIRPHYELILQRQTPVEIDETRETARVPKVLCVDDDPDIQTAIKIRLERFALDVECGFFGLQGIVEATKSAPDLIITDLNMPNGDGNYLIDCLKRNPKTSSIPIIVLTANRAPRLKQRILNAGADAFLQKPILFDQLIKNMSRFIKIRNPEQK